MVVSFVCVLFIYDGPEGGKVTGGMGNFFTDQIVVNK